MYGAVKQVFWAGLSQKGSRSFLKPVLCDIGQALYTAPCRQTDPSVKPLKGDGGARVSEIVAPHDMDTYRAVYRLSRAL